ncbi:CLIP3 [Symbiodinium sp. KB8]|nr:CLIP3 [Symbiodinium sp. KB8]
MALKPTKRATMMQATRASIAAPASPDGKTAVVGDQVVIALSDQQLRGIVRFAGGTKFAPGDWLGIELEKKAGKNNGSVKGEVYFVLYADEDEEEQYSHQESWDPAQLMLADAEYDPTRQAFVHEHRTRWLTLRVTEDHSESGWLGRKQEEKAEPRGRLEALQSLEFCNTACIVLSRLLSASDMGEVTVSPQERLFDAVSAINEVAEELTRRLQTEECTEGVDLTDGHNVAQIIQGVGFMFLAMWLIFANNSKVAVAQKAPLEQRHNICATISTAVALFSGFFNILQLTAIDDFDLPGRTNNFTLNLSRPVEWILTCPIMQLKLVVLAGSRVPSYRRFMMPLISVAVLLCGTASMFTGDALRFAWYGFGLSLASIMFYHNALQIKENSEGEESFLHGDSDFRKLSLCLILTWFPFPMWFSLSVEGFGVITDGFIIEMGWVVLNIVSKFVFIIWLQRMKMVHQRKVESTRELYGLSASDDMTEGDLKQKAISVGTHGGVKAENYGLGQGEEAESEVKLAELVAETMVTLGMSSHTDRMLRLMVDNGVTNTAVLERLNQERCMELNLPWALIDATQRRWTAEKMNMGQDQGGSIEKEDPFKKLLDANKERVTGKNLINALPNMPGMLTPPLAGGMVMDIGGMEDQILSAVNRALVPVQDMIMSRMQVLEENLQRQLETSQEALSQRMDFSQISLLQTVNACQVLLQKLDSSQETVMQKMDTQKAVVDQMVNSYSGLVKNIDGASDSTKRALLDTVNSSSDVLLQKLDATQQDLLKQSQDSHSVLQTVAQTQTTLAKKVDTGNEFTQKRLVEMESCIERKVDALGAAVAEGQAATSEKIIQASRADLAALASQGNAMLDATEKSAAQQEQRMTDVRRQNLMILDLLTNAQQAMQGSAESLENFTRSEIMRDSAANMETQIRDVIMQQMSKLQDAFLGGDDEGDGNSFKAAVTSMVMKLEESAARLETASTPAEDGEKQADMLNNMRQELAALAAALAQQQQEASQQSMLQVSEALRAELLPLKDSQTEVTGVLTEKVAELQDSVAQNLAKFEMGMDKVLQTVEASSAKPSSQDKRSSRQADRSG